MIVAFSQLHKLWKNDFAPSLQKSPPAHHHHPQTRQGSMVTETGQKGGYGKQTRGSSCTCSAQAGSQRPVTPVGEAQSPHSGDTLRQASVSKARGDRGPRCGPGGRLAGRSGGSERCESESRRQGCSRNQWSVVFLKRRLESLPVRFVSFIRSGSFLPRPRWGHSRAECCVLI